jgi:hypothetical protein
MSTFDEFFPKMKQWFPENYGIFKQDGAACYTAKVVMNYLYSHNVEVLEWPGNSPDMNPTDNIWKEMDCVSKLVVPLCSSSLTGCFKSGITIKDLSS